MNTPKMFFVVALAAFVGVPAIAEEPVATAENESQEHSRNAPIDAQTQISNVIVFPSGARITRSAKIKLSEKGVHTLFISGVPVDVQEKSILAETQIAGAQILSVSTKINHEEKRSTEEIDKIRSTLTDAQIRENELNARLQTTEIQRQKLLELKPIPPTAAPGTPYAFDTDAALSALRFLKEESEKLSEEILSLKEMRDQARLDREVAESEARKRSSYPSSTRTVTVKIKVLAESEGNLDVHYIASDAHWRPSYDIQVNPTSKTATLVSYGVVSQRTGEDWNGVPVSLSTANPEVSANLPEFQKRLITERFDTNQRYDSAFAFIAGAGSLKSSSRKKERALDKAQRILDDAGQNSIILQNGQTLNNVHNIRYQAGLYVFNTEDGALKKMNKDEVQSFNQAYVESETGDIQHSRLFDPSRSLNGLDFRYELARPETIKSTDTPHRYLLKSETYHGDFYYRISPSVNTHAYQMLDVKNTNFRPILAGPANIFYDSDFIGDMNIPYLSRQGIVSIPLGVDPRISVDRQKINAIETVGTFTSSRRNDVNISIKIHNRTAEKIRFLCTEAIPISQQEAIEISSPKFSPAISSFFKDSNIAEWDNTLEPNEKIELRVNYKIGYPVDFALEERPHPHPIFPKK